jgi:LacI family transcriptional regulator
MSIYDIARLAGVSITTVSRVINNQKKVGKERRLRVLEVIDKFEYRPDPLAQTLARRKNGKSETNPV